MRADIKQTLHASHLEIESCLRRAKECVFWHGMNSEIKDFNLSCEVCQRHSHAQPKEPLTPHPQPAYPWERVGTDIMKYTNRNFLVTVDYFSNFGEVDELTSTTASAVIRKLKAHSARCGIPAMLISDNGPQFASARFAEFATQWQFIHNTSGPGHAQSNRMVNRPSRLQSRFSRRP